MRRASCRDATWRETERDGGETGRERETARDREMGERKTYITTYRSATCNIKHQREGGRERETERDRERQRERETEGDLQESMPITGGPARGPLAAGVWVGK